MNLAIIPARKSSKRIKNKNIIDFFGEPIIAKTIKLIKNTNLFTKIIVTSDSKKILNISKKYGAEIYLRKKKLAGDKIPISNVLRDLLININLNINNVFYFYPTSIFIKKKYLLDSLKILKKKPNSMVLSVCEYSHPIERALIMNSKNEIEFKYKKNILKQTQYFKKSYYDAGQFGLAKKEYFLNNVKNNKKIIGYILSDYEACDIDNSKDLKKAKFLFKKLKNE
jgi:pseudaminic acid cytidylyltransferase